MFLIYRTRLRVISLSIHRRYVVIMSVNVSIISWANLPTCDCICVSGLFRRKTVFSVLFKEGKCGNFLVTVSVNGVLISRNGSKGTLSGNELHLQWLHCRGGIFYDFCLQPLRTGQFPLVDYESLSEI